MPKTVYHYDRETLVYLHAGDACESPVRKGSYLPIAFTTDEAPPDVPGGFLAVFDPGANAWTVVAIPAEPVAEPPAPLTLVQRMAAMEAAADAWIDGTAQSLGYSSIVTAVSYADEPAVPKFQREGKALRAWRSLVYARCYEVRAEVLAGGEEPADFDALRALLPAFELPAEPAPEAVEE